jgi:hypothetical protein
MLLLKRGLADQGVLNPVNPSHLRVVETSYRMQSIERPARTSSQPLLRVEERNDRRQWKREKVEVPL